jgi:hypothetical protein
MKEVANCLPCLYICLKEEARGHGYPHRSPSIVEWVLTGAATILPASLSRNIISVFSTFRWSAFTISTVSKLATWIDDGRFFTSLGIDDWKGKKLESAWLWKFFAQPPIAGKNLINFWLEVQKAIYSMLLRYPDRNFTHTYFPKEPHE